MVRFAPDTAQGRHVLIVRCGPWALLNAHAHSGSQSSYRDFRNRQLELLSFQHECDEEHVQVLAGDFNMRERGRPMLLSAALGGRNAGERNW